MADVPKERDRAGKKAFAGLIIGWTLMIAIMASLAFYSVTVISPKEPSPVVAAETDMLCPCCRGSGAVTLRGPTCAGVPDNPTCYCAVCGGTGVIPRDLPGSLEERLEEIKRIMEVADDRYVNGQNMVDGEADRIRALAMNDRNR